MMRGGAWGDPREFKAMFFGPGTGHGGPGGRGRGRGRARRGDVRAAMLILLEGAAERLPAHPGDRAPHGGAVEAQPGLRLPRAAAARGRGPGRADEQAGRRAYELTEQGREYVEANREELGDPFAAVRGGMDEGVMDLRGLMFQVGAAAMQVAAAGHADDARRILTDTRRALYSILAGGPRRHPRGVAQAGPLPTARAVRVPLGRGGGPAAAYTLRGVPRRNGEVTHEDILWVRWNERARDAHPEIVEAIARFYALTAGQVELAGGQREKLGLAHPTQGAILITWSARSATHRLDGRLLVNDPIGIAQEASEGVAAAVLALDPFDGATAEIWRKRYKMRNSRTRLPAQEGEPALKRMYLPLREPSIG